MNKQHILREIRRTAGTNDGIPLGRERFARETGIRTADWLGKFWARWGDAVSEAGFNPNKLQAALDESILIEKFIALMRELRRFPVEAELRMKARSDGDFPSHSVFGRLGSKQQRAARIIEYCSEREGFEDIIALCEAVPRDYEQRSRETPAKAEESLGFVYLMKSGRYYKIGRSNASGRREYELAIQMPEKLQTLHTIRTDDPIGIEGYWHKRFELKRKNGEWFDLTGEDVRAFKRRKFHVTWAFRRADARRLDGRVKAGHGE